MHYAKNSEFRFSRLRRQLNVSYLLYTHFYRIREEGGSGSGGGVSESTDRRGCAILALEMVPKNLISHKNPTQKFILQDFMLAISTKKTMHH